MRHLIALLLFLGLAPLAYADIESVAPACGVEGDYVLLCGDFGDDPVVMFGGEDAEAEVIRGIDGKIVVTVPPGLDAGTVTIDVDGSTIDFTIVDPGAPVVHHLSARKASEGTSIYVIGDRLTDGTVEFVDGDDQVAATATLEGQRYIAFFEVPAGLAPADYTLRFINGDGLNTDPCSPSLEIFEKGPPAVDEITPAEQQPGYAVTITGTNLGPWGNVQIDWTPEDGGDTIQSLGFANGADMVYAWVPFDAEGGVTYDVVLTFRDGTESPAVSYLVGFAPPPTIDHLEFDAGPARSTLGIFGSGFATGGGGLFGIRPLAALIGNPNGFGDVDVSVAFTQGDTSVDADVLFVFPGFGFGDDGVFVRVPDLEDGDYEVTVTVGDETSNAVTFTVATLPLTVTSMSPTTHRADGFPPLILIEGTGFGPYDIFTGSNVTVTFDDGVNEPREGFVLHHDDRKIMLLPPLDRLKDAGNGGDPIFVIGGGEDGDFDFGGLPPGEYTVTVDNGDESVVAGTYTVTE